MSVGALRAGSRSRTHCQRGTQRIAELGKIEDGIRGCTHKEHSTAWQERDRPITDRIAPWLREQLGFISQRTKLAEAIRRARSH